MDIFFEIVFKIRDCGKVDVIFFNVLNRFYVKSLSSLIRFVVFSFVAFCVLPQTRAQKRCVEVLQPHNCKLYDCKKACFLKHRENSGSCVQNGPGDDYSCVCTWEC